MMYRKLKYSHIGSLLLSVFLCFFLIVPNSVIADSAQVQINTGEMDVNYSKKVLILNSYHQGYSWTDRATNSILDKFIERNIDVQVHIENMDTKRILNKNAWFELLKQKLEAYPSGYLDLIIASDDNAVYSLYKIGHKYHTEPIVYFGVSEDLARHSDTCSMFIGVEEYLPFKENIELGLELFPETEHIAIVTDKSKTGISHYHAARKTVREMNIENIDFIWINGYQDLSTKDMMERLRDLPENTFIIFSIWQIDGDNRYWDPVKYYPEYAKATNAPFFTVLDIGIDNAFLGGMVTVPENQGQLAAELGIQLLYGELLEDLPRVKDKNEYHFNWEELNRWNIRIKDIPKGSVILNKPQTVYNQYRTFFFLTLSLIIIMFILFWLLLLYHFRYRNYELQRTEMANWTKRLANRYNILFEQSNNAIVIFNLDTGVIIAYNEKSKELFGSKNKGMDEFSLKDYFPNYKELQENIDKLLIKPFEMELYKGDKSSFHAQVMLSLLNEENNNYVYAIINDISYRKEQEEEIRISKARLNETLQNSKNSYWEWDLVNKKLYKDINFWMALDIDPATLKEDPMDSDYYMNSIYHQDRIKFEKIIEEAVNGKRNTFLAEIRMNFHRQINWVEIRGDVSKRDEQGIGTEISGFMMNINERKHQEEELIKAKEKAEESDRLKSAFISNISHEIRTPLNGIVGFSNLLGRENLSLEDKRKYLSFINENNDFLLKLINDILEISKIETDSVNINYDSCNLAQLCENIIAQERMYLPPTVTMIMREGQNINVQIDKMRLTQVLKNLISNARKFTEEGNIEIGYETKLSKIEFYIRDTGIGIDPEMQEKVFERFVQVDPFSSGTGLGLSISKALIEKMGGEIRLESEKNKGTTVYFTVDYKKAKLKISDVEPGIKPKTDKNLKKTILIAEDDESSFVLLNVVLTGKYEVIRSQDEETVFEHIKRYHPDIMIADIDMTGFTQETVIKAREILPLMKIIGLSDNTLDFIRNKELADLLDDRLSKPINIKSMLEMLEDLTETE